jgi:hypothetical protein
MRVSFPKPNAIPVTFNVAHVDLYFFYDIDVAILVVEVYADELPLWQAQNALFRLGRCYPTYWEPDGHGGHCPKYVEWLSSGCPQTTKYCQFRTMKIRGNTFHLSASIDRRLSLRTGNSCSDP